MRNLTRSTTLFACSLTLVVAPMLAACSDADDGTTPTESSTPQTSASQETAEQTSRGADLATTTFAVSWTDALQTAQDNFSGEPVEVALDWHRDRYAYEVELVSATEEYEVKVDADTGETFDEQTEPLSSDDAAEKRAKAFDATKVVDWKAALKTALDATEGTVNEWKLEGKSNRGPQYEFDIDATSGEDVEVAVDAVKGTLLTTDD